jgi:ribosomal protein S18 acetylase RimI-like enzyme
MNLKIREAKLTDTEDILSLVCYLSQTDTTLEDAKKMYEKFLKSGVFNQFVAEIEGKIVGMIGVVFMLGFRDHEKMIGYLQRLVVDPNYRKQGIGSALVKYAINFCNKDCYKVILHSQNEEAIKIYEKAGFKKHSVLLELTL